MNIPDERLIEFYGVNREAGQLRKGGVAGTKIVEMNLRPQPAELLDHGERQLFVLDETAFG